MANFEERKQAHETEFARDEALRFKANARRNRLLGLWAAELLGKTGEDAEEYAREVIRADMEEAGDEDVFRKLRADLDAAGIDRSDHQIRRTMEEMLMEAVDQLKAEAQAQAEASSD